jgi:RNA polymerase sigma factor (sigma-70 family)
MAPSRVSSCVPPFQSLLDAYGRSVHRMLVAIAGPVDADDLYQETWLAALRAYPSLRDDANLRSWVMTIAHRKAMDHFRAVRRRPLPTEHAPEPAVAPVAPADGVWSQVAALPTKQRAAVALRYIADASYPEIAAAMDTSEDAARRNVHEALKRLRREVAQ